MTAKKQRGNNDGAVLLTVLTVACFAAILLTAVLSFVGRAHTNAYNNYNSEQAYYIASSALGSIHDYFEEADGSYTKLLEMANANSNAGTTGTLKFSDGSDTIEMSELVKDSNCTVKVSRMGDGYIKLSVTGYCRGQAETINAYYTVEEGKSLGGIDNALYCDGTATFSNKASSAGPLTTRNNYETSDGSTGNGTIVTGRDFIINASGYYWRSESGDKAKSYIIVGHNFYVKDNQTVFDPQNVKVNDNTDQFISIGGQFYPYSQTTIGSDGGKDMDVYCNNAFMANNQPFNLYGNLYCYKLTEDEFNKVHEHPHTTDDELKKYLDYEKHIVVNGTNIEVKYKTAMTLEDNGDMYINNQTNSVNIRGSVYVEGDVIIGCPFNHGFVISNDLYLGAESKFIYNESGDYNQGITLTKLHAPGLTDADVVKLIKAKVLSFPITETRQEWLNKLNAANEIDLHGLLAPYFDNNSFSHDVPATREFKPDTNFDTYQRDYEITQDYLNKHTEIKAAYEGATDDITMYYVGVGAADGHTSPAMHDDLLGLDIDYLINDPSKTGCVISSLNGGESVQGDGNKNGAVVLVDLNAIGHDFVIKLKPNDGGTQVNLSGTNEHPAVIIVKNGKRDYATGKWISGKEPKHNLYIITDEGAPGTDITVSTDHFGVMDYYTYSYVIKNKYAINLTAHLENDKLVDDIFVPESTSTYLDASSVKHGVYTPPLTRYYFMINPGDVFSVANDGNYFLECVLYASKARINSNGVYGYRDALFLKSKQAGETLRTLSEGFNAPGRTGSYLCCLGAMICDVFDGHQTFGVTFFPPCPDAGLGGSKMETEDKIEFSHYESR